MYCPDCGSQNPAGNKFCGMCGERLPERGPREARPIPSPDKATDALPRPRTAEMQTKDVIRATDPDRRERLAELDPEPVRASLRHRESIDESVREVKPVAPTPIPVNRSSNALAEEYIPESAMPPAVANFYAHRMESSTPIEQPTTLSGPSFLGLSNSPSGDSSYSYLYEDEQPKSHGGLVFLLVLAILAGVVYWKWQPIHDYVVNAAVEHSNAGRPAPTQGTGSDSAAQNAQPANAGQNGNPNGTPQQDNAAAAGDKKSDQPKSDDAQPKSQATPDKSGADKTDNPKDERPQSEVGQKSRFQDVKGKKDEAPDEDAEDTKPSSAKPHVQTQPAGAELVASGEKYLYGKGVPRNCNQAVNAFNEAAKQQNSSAMSHLGALYATGECVPFNRVEAYQWFSRALSQNRGNSYLEHNLNMLWREMSSQEQAQVTGKKMF